MSPRWKFSVKEADALGDAALDLPADLRRINHHPLVEGLHAVQDAGSHQTWFTATPCPGVKAALMRGEP